MIAVEDEFRVASSVFEFIEFFSLLLEHDAKKQQKMRVK